MYEQFFGLTADPFRLSSDPYFCFNHKSYSKARAYMQFALHRAEGFLMITGRPGTGKTTLINDLTATLDPAKIKVATLVSAQLGAEDLLRMTAYAFGLETQGVAQKALVLQRLMLFLLEQDRQQRRCLLIIDEAQDLSATALEELRLLTNIQRANRPLLQVFLIGQENLRELVRRPELEQVHQRLVAAWHLEPLTPAETVDYVRHRLEKAGWRGDPAFKPGVLAAVYQFSQGIPRRINLICSRLLLQGFINEAHAITVEDAQRILAELRQEELAPAPPQHGDTAMPAATPDWSRIDQGLTPPLAPPPPPPERVAPPVRADTDVSFVASPRPTPPATRRVEPTAPRVATPPRSVVADEDTAAVAPSSVSPPASSSGSRAARTSANPTPTLLPPAESAPAATAAPPPVMHDAERPAPARTRRRWGRWALGWVLLTLLGGLLGVVIARPAWLPPVLGEAPAAAYSWVQIQLDLLASVFSGRPPTRLPAPGVPASAPPSAAPAAPPPAAPPAPPAVPPSYPPAAPEAAAETATSALTLPSSTTPSVNEPPDTPAAASAASVPPPELLRAVRVLFAWNKTDLDDSARDLLDDCARQLRDNNTYFAEIVGYADNRGDPAYNLILSQQRAHAVADALVARGIDRARLSVAGKGMADEHAAAEAASRRVEIRLWNRLPTDAASRSRMAVFAALTKTKGENPSWA